MRKLVIALAVWMLGASLVAAQQGVWIQVEAQPSLQDAEDRVRTYAATLPDVAGFQISGRWYGIAIGPYEPADAAQRLITLRAQGLIPQDAFIAGADRFLRQFWPIGANDLTRATRPIAPLAAAPAPADLVAPTEASVSTTAPEALDETPQEAQASENLLTRDEKRL